MEDKDGESKKGGILSMDESGSELGLMAMPDEVVVPKRLAGGGWRLADG